MDMKLVKHLIVALAAVWAMAPAKAELLDLGSTTFDTESGLEWLDLQASLGYTVDDIANERIAALQGWRMATLPEVQSIFLGFGFKAEEADYPGSDVAAQTALDRAASFLGSSYSDGPEVSVVATVNAPTFDAYAQAYFYPLVGAFQGSGYDADWNVTPVIAVDLLVPGNGNGAVGAKALGAAHFLVRENASLVPEASTGWLFLLGLVTLGFMACKQGGSKRRL